MSAESDKLIEDLALLLVALRLGADPQRPMARIIARLGVFGHPDPISYEDALLQVLKDI